MLVIYVKMIHIAVRFDDFEFKWLINNEVQVFDRISQSGMKMVSNNILAVKTKCENTVPIIYVEIIHIGLGFDDSNVCLTIRSTPWKKAAALRAKNLTRGKFARQSTSCVAGSRYLRQAMYGIICSLKRHLEEVKGASAFNPLD